MTEREQLVRACISVGREDDTPRLAYADFCQDSGREDYAEFIRWSVANPDVQDLSYRHVDKRHLYLLWFDTLFGHLFTNDVYYRPSQSVTSSWQFHKGFLQIQCSQKFFLDVICDSEIFAHMDCDYVILSDRKHWTPHCTRYSNKPDLWSCGVQRGDVTDAFWHPDNNQSIPNAREHYERVRNYGIDRKLFELMPCDHERTSKADGYSGQVTIKNFYGESESDCVQNYKNSLSLACCVYGIRRHDELVAKAWKEETVEGKYA